MKQFKLPLYNNGKLTVGIYRYQLLLMEAYHERGMLMQWNHKFNDIAYKNQLSKNITWIVEELEEVSRAYEHLRYTVMDIPDRKGTKEAVEQLVLEIGDVMSFFIELLIFSEIEPEDLASYYAELLDERNLGLLKMEDPLHTSIAYANHDITWDDPIRITRHIATEITELKGVRLKISLDMQAEVERTMWEITKWLIRAGRIVKHKEWSTRVKEVNVQDYKLHVMQAWLYYTRLIVLCGLDTQAMYHYYEQVNFKNQSRLANEY